MNSSISISVLYPGIASNLSLVPPVKPSPLPDIFATFTPKEATIGISIRVILSPIPPVLCLSTTFPTDDKSSTSPE